MSSGTTLDWPLEDEDEFDELGLPRGDEPEPFPPDEFPDL